MSPAHLHQYVASISPGQISESLPSSQVKIYFSTLQQHPNTLTQHERTQRTHRNNPHVHARVPYNHNYLQTLFANSDQLFSSNTTYENKWAYTNTYISTNHFCRLCLSSLFRFVNFYRFVVTLRWRMHDGTCLYSAYSFIRCLWPLKFLGMFSFGYYFLLTVIREIDPQTACMGNRFGNVTSSDVWIGGKTIELNLCRNQSQFTL